MKRKELETMEKTGLREIERRLKRIEKLADALNSLVDELREYVAEEKAKKPKRRPLIF